jgi:dihydropteroate synthase
MARGAGPDSTARTVDSRAEASVRFADGGVLRLGRRTAVMGILNVTPDSFSDGGRHAGPRQALEAARAMLAGGADLIDVGGESTRPGAAPVDAAEEIRRVVPVIEAIKRELDVRVSVDTSKAAVARAALDAGADMVNDVSALGDEAMLPLLRERGVPVVLMHRRGTPRTMQSDTGYGALIDEVRDFLARRAAAAVEAGVAGDRILVDPGIGFGKSAAGNLSILRRLPEFASVGRPIVIGASRKSFLGEAAGRPVDDRLEESLAVAALASARGAHVIRAHDAASTVRVVRMVDAVRNG